jgi:integrase
MESLRQYKQEECEIVNFPIKKDAKLTKAGDVKMTPNNSIEGESKEVYPIKSKEDVERIKQYFLNRSEEATNNEDKKIYARYAMLWVVGINIGLRGSDLVKLKWGDIFYEEREYKSEGSRVKEKKTDKYKTLFLNKYAKTAIDKYIDEFNPSLNSENFIFKSREEGHIQVQTLGKALQKAAHECGIKVNVNTHTIRKTFGYFWYKGHLGDNEALIHLQKLFNHASPRVTLRYIGIDDEQTEKYYNDLEW